MNSVNLTKKQKEAMKLVIDGADVSSPFIARELRTVEKNYPKLIHITKPMGDYDGRGHVPYFGAILTNEGREAILE